MTQNVSLSTSYFISATTVARFWFCEILVLVKILVCVRLRKCEMAEIPYLTFRVVVSQW